MDVDQGETDDQNKVVGQDVINNNDNNKDTPRKKRKKISKFHRIHAHRNPLSDGEWVYPPSPEYADWSVHYPTHFQSRTDDSPPLSPNQKLVEFADIGCGYGGLLVALGEMFPENLSLGIEIRGRVVEYVQQRITSLRSEHVASQKYQNISVLNTNAMKYLPNFFFKGQLKKIFFLFADPHFKKANHRRRIISPTLLSEYAYVLAEGAKLYAISDVADLFQWEEEHLNAHPLFDRVSEEENQKDPVVDLICNSSEEAKKVAKAGGKKFFGVWRRIPNPIKHD